MKRLIFVLILVSICTSSFAGMTDKITMDFRDTDVREILKIISVHAGFGMVSEKSVRGNLTISVKDVSAKAALDLVTKASGFAWEQIGNTVFVADEKKLSKREIKVINLKFLSAGEVAKILSISILGDLKLATNYDGNSIVLNGSRNAIDQAMLIVSAIDKPQRYVKASLKFAYGEKIIHEFHFSARVGAAIELTEHLKFDPIKVGEDKKHNVSALECGLRIREVASDGFLNVEMKMSMKRVDRSTDSETDRTFAGQFGAEKGQAVEVVKSSKNDPLKVIFTWEK